jgi:hypothetical protein
MLLCILNVCLYVWICWLDKADVHFTHPNFEIMEFSKEFSFYKLGHSYYVFIKGQLFIATYLRIKSCISDECSFLKSNLVHDILIIFNVVTAVLVWSALSAFF